VQHSIGGFGTQPNGHGLCSFGRIPKLKGLQVRSLSSHGMRNRSPHLPSWECGASDARGVHISSIDRLSMAQSRQLSSFCLCIRVTVMNFVDVQPDSFLDYAFTSPSPNVMTSTKSSRTNRKQNRCCDQCRKGKRACDAAILEDALLDDTKAKGNSTAFHYSGELDLVPVG
jgi:hypothetical protein